MPVTSAGSLSTSTAYVVVSATATTFTIATAAAPSTALSITTSTATNIIVASPSFSFSTFYPAMRVAIGGDNQTLTAANNQLANGDMVYFQGKNIPTGVSAGIAYYVINTNTTVWSFQVSASAGGSALTLGSTGTESYVYSPTHAINWLVPSMPVTGSDGAWTAYVQVAAGSGKTNQTSQSFTLDTTPPIIAISSPSSGTRSVGNLTLVGTSTDPGIIPSGVTGSIQYQIGTGYSLTNAASWTSANVIGGSYSWTISLGDMSSYANATKATQCNADGSTWNGSGSPTNLWRLPIVFQAMDKAGNVGQLISYYVILDPNGNVPVVSINQPATGLTFGGQQTITGTATQPVAIYGVEVAVDPAGGNNFPPNPLPVTIPSSGSTITMPTVSATALLAGTQYTIATLGTTVIW